MTESERPYTVIVASSDPHKKVGDITKVMMFEKDGPMEAEAMGRVVGEATIGEFLAFLREQHLEHEPNLIRIMHMVSPIRFYKIWVD